MKYIPWIFGLIIFSGTLVSMLIASGTSLDVINPVGAIAEQQKDLLFFAIGLSMLVVIPVFAMTIFFAYKYRVKNKSAYYAPDWDSNKAAEATWWGVPILLIFVLGIVTYQTTFALDPYKPIESQRVPLEIQAVALEWKWLFIYPDYDIASMNELRLPKDVPINFKITADAPMNALWIPALGSQVYAMNGMQTKLHLISEEVSTVTGKSSNISGEGFAKMNFPTITSEQSEFNSWVDTVKREGFTLGLYRYDELAKPSIPQEKIYYSKIEPNLFNIIMKRYMPHGGH